MPISHKHDFPRACRLRGRGTFKAIRDAGVRESRGPLTLWADRNDVGHLRLGIGIGRVVGNAVRRNRIKRLLREAFRLMRNDVPQGYDLVVSVRRHKPLILAEYQKLLMSLLLKAHTRLKDRPCDGS